MGVNQCPTIGGPGCILPDKSAQSLGGASENGESPKLAHKIRTPIVFDQEFGSILRDIQRKNRIGSRRNPDRLAPEMDICVMPKGALKVMVLAKPR